MSLHTGLDQIREPEMPYFSIGGVIGRSLWITLWNYFPFIGMAIVLAIPLVACTILIVFLAGNVGFSFDIGLTYVHFKPQGGADLGLAGFLGLLTVFTVLAPSAAYTQRAYQSMLGRRASFGNCIVTSLAALPKLIVLGILLIFSYGAVGWLIANGFAKLAAPAFGFGWIFVTTLLSLTVYMFLFAIWWLAIPVLVIESAGPFASLRRSWNLTRGRRWQIVAIWVLLAVPNVLIQYLLTRIVPGQIGSDAGQVIALAVDVARVFVAMLFYFMGTITAAIGYFHLVGEKEGILALDRVFA
jgi:hypothetical protein